MTNKIAHSFWVRRNIPGKYIEDNYILGRVRLLSQKSSKVFQIPGSKLEQNVFTNNLWVVSYLFILTAIYISASFSYSELKWEEQFVSIILTTQSPMWLMSSTLSYRILPTWYPKQITSQVLECNHCWLSCPLIIYGHGSWWASDWPKGLLWWKTEESFARMAAHHNWELSRSDPVSPSLIIPGNKIKEFCLDYLHIASQPICCSAA